MNQMINGILSAVQFCKKMFQKNDFFYNHIRVKMAVSLLGRYKTRNVTGFTLEHTYFGKIFFGHFDPIHKEPYMRDQMAPVFADSNIVVGDLNAGLRQLTSRTKYNIIPLLQPNEFAYVYNPVSYLPPVQPNLHDASIDMIISRLVQPIPVNVGIDFSKIRKYQSPRDMIKDINFPSDHRPLKAILADTKKENMITIAFWNVADPLFWSEFYQNAMIGFSAEEEDNRLKLILSWLDKLLPDCDIFGLAEVPVNLISRLQELGKKYKMNIKYTSEHLDVWRPNLHVSQMVVMWK